MVLRLLNAAEPKPTLGILGSLMPKCDHCAERAVHVRFDVRNTGSVDGWLTCERGAMHATCAAHSV